MITNIINATLTAYCACKEVCTKGTGITANGNKPIQGQTIAASRKIRLGSLVSYNGQVYQVQDRMHRKYDNEYRFDIYFTKHSDAKKFGIKTNQTIKIITTK